MLAYASAKVGKETMQLFSQMITRPERLVCAIAVTVGLIFASIGGATALYESKFQQRSAIVNGRVVDQQPRRSCNSNDDCHTSMYPVVQFDVDGQRVTFASNTTGLLSPRTGEIVPVRYDPANPYDAEISSFESEWGLSLIFGLIGLALVGVGVVVLVQARQTSTYSE
ncbi:DUF3592 domain-containing protein [Mycobacteroides abscessus subsp. massiliense]|nr:DUF3592 domain-containing protein [Mycobacteroides abscessus]MBN7316043.1 DUF3592 domain-containing protein [Mycobacteroides abscessus subsp. massiliense]